MAAHSRMITGFHAGKSTGHGFCQFCGAVDSGEIVAQRVSRRDRFKRHQRHGGGEPEIKIAVEAAVGKQIEHRRQHQRRVIAAGLGELFFAKAHALAKPQPVAGSAGAGRGDLHRMFTAKTAETDGQHRLHILQLHGMIREAQRCAGFADQPVPGAADGFFQFQKVQHGLSSWHRTGMRGATAQPGVDIKARYRMIASATSCSAAFTSGSSVSGSIMVARTAWRAGRPVSMRLAQ